MEVRGLLCIIAELSAVIRAEGMERAILSEEGVVEAPARYPFDFPIYELE